MKPAYKERYCARYCPNCGDNRFRYKWNNRFCRIECMNCDCAFQRFRK